MLISLCSFFPPPSCLGRDAATVFLRGLSLDPYLIAAFFIGGVPVPFHRPRRLRGSSRKRLALALTNNTRSFSRPCTRSTTLAVTKRTSQALLGPPWPVPHHAMKPTPLATRPRNVGYGGRTEPRDLPIWSGIPTGLRMERNNFPCASQMVRIRHVPSLNLLLCRFPASSPTRRGPTKLHGGST